MNAAEWAGDPAWALAITERWEMADPHHFFVNVDPYLREPLLGAGADR